MNRKIEIFFAILMAVFGSFSCDRKDKTTSLFPNTNNPPVINSIKMIPDKMTQGGEVNTFVQGYDPDGDSVVFQYQWLKNNQELIGENKSSLKMAHFKKGDFIRVKVIPSDGKEEGKPFFSESIKVLNSPPLIEKVHIEPREAYITSDLKASVKATDPDGDFIYYSYQWEKNGEPILEEKEEVLKNGQFKKGDAITVIVTPDDQESFGKSVKSDPVIILNSPPLIISSPPASTKGKKYLYQLKANDPDGDPITFSLKTSPRGMKIDKDTGLIQWEIREEDRGNQTVEIEVSDEEGAKSIQKYIFSIDIK